MLQGRVVPSSDQLSVESWVTRARLGSGSLLGAGCQGEMLLAGHDQHTQNLAHDLGQCLALAVRAHDEKIMFTEEGGVNSGALFSLASLPVQLHLQQDPELLSYIQDFSSDLSQLNYRKIYDAVISGQALETTSELIQKYVDESSTLLKQFGDNEATEAINKITSSII